MLVKKITDDSTVSQLQNQTNPQTTSKLLIAIHSWVHRGEADSPHKGSVMWKNIPCHDVIMECHQWLGWYATDKKFYTSTSIHLKGPYIDVFRKKSHASSPTKSVSIDTKPALLTIDIYVGFMYAMLQLVLITKLCYPAAQWAPKNCCERFLRCDILQIVPQQILGDNIQHRIRIFKHSQPILAWLWSKVQYGFHWAHVLKIKQIKFFTHLFGLHRFVHKSLDLCQGNWTRYLNSKMITYSCRKVVGKMQYWMVSIGIGCSVPWFYITPWGPFY